MCRESNLRAFHDSGPLPPFITDCVPAQLLPSTAAHRVRAPRPAASECGAADPGPPRFGPGTRRCRLPAGTRSPLPAPGTRRCRLLGLGAGSRCLGGAPLGHARRSHKHMLTALPDGPPRRSVGKAPSRSASRPYCCPIDV